MTDILLNREGDANPPTGYLLITSEVDFLCWAGKNQNIMVQGERLCAWARVFYQARGIPWIETKSIKSEIQAICPKLTDENIQTMIQQHGERLQKLSRPLTTQGLLQSLYPSAFWNTPVSLRHAAEWLLWLVREDPKDYAQPLLQQIREIWLDEANHSARDAYKDCTRNQAQKRLDQWLGTSDPSGILIPEVFPLEVPQDYQEKARLVWTKRIIESHGNFFDQLEKQNIPFSLKKLAAKEACRYFIKNPDELTSSRIEQLSVYLNQSELTQLRQCIAPTEPEKMRDEPLDVLIWFRNSYLPYREWQHLVNAPQGKEKVLKAAYQFATWYLERYPKALAGESLQKWLSFYKVNDLNLEKNCLTLIVVLDGLHATDARFLQQSIQSHTQRLSLITDELVFAPIPTITKYAKEALFHGVSPVKAPEVEPIGKILPEDQSPANRLARDQENGIYLWRVLEPDRTYHFKNKSENLRQDIEGRLEAEALKIKEIVEMIPDNMIMQVIITSDHGRMLGEATRTIPLPEGMQGHGRVAWGKSGKIFPKSGYIIEESLAYLFSESFGLPDDVVIPLDESAFYETDKRKGSEIYPHGGLFPEEIIVPWIVYARDYVRPEVEITISGQARARRIGTLQIHILNQSNVDLTLKDIVISLNNGVEKRLDLEMAVNACTESTHRLEFDPWPSPTEIKGATAVVRFLQSNQLVFDYPAKLQIKSEDMYVEADNPLEDMV